MLLLFYALFYYTQYLVRALIRFDTAPIDGYDLSSLRVLGSVGEPINPEAWKWVRRLIAVFVVFCTVVSLKLCSLSYIFKCFSVTEYSCMLSHSVLGLQLTLLLFNVLSLTLHIVL